VGVAKAYLGQCDMGREMQCGLHGVAQIEGSKARCGSRDARRGADRGALGADRGALGADTGARGAVSPPSEGLPSVGLLMRG
jgi:hypothetical protein